MITKHLLIIMLIALALGTASCGFPLPELPTSGGGSDPSMEETRVALAIQATSLAMEIQSATQIAASQPDPTDPPPAPTQPPPTQLPAPTSAPAQPTAQAPTAEPPAPEGPSGGEVVEGSLTRSASDPAANYGPPAISEDFEGTTGIFPARSDGASRSWYADGRYNISFTTLGRYAWYWTHEEGGDFYAETVMINGDECVQWDRGGMLFRGDVVSDTAYFFGVTCDGNYFIADSSNYYGDAVCYIWDGGSNWDCTYPKMTPSEYIAVGPGAVNRIGIMAQGGEYSFYINGNYVDGFSEWAYLGFVDIPRGPFALFLGTHQRDKSRVHFEEFNVWSLP